MKVDLFQISKNMESETFSFVEFSSSKSALACVEGINNANIVEEGFKVSYPVFLSPSVIWDSSLTWIIL